jgi:hypothetical protein
VWHATAMRTRAADGSRTATPGEVVVDVVREVLLAVPGVRHEALDRLVVGGDVGRLVGCWRLLADLAGASRADGTAVADLVNVDDRRPLAGEMARLAAAAGARQAADADGWSSDLDGLGPSPSWRAPTMSLDSSVVSGGPVVDEPVVGDVATSALYVAGVRADPSPLAHVAVCCMLGGAQDVRASVGALLERLLVRVGRQADPDALEVATWAQRSVWPGQEHTREAGRTGGDPSVWPVPELLAAGPVLAALVLIEGPEALAAAVTGAARDLDAIEGPDRG